ncbi:TetR/AcrR family transcriptional regulator [Alkalibacillus silvisoli]|uniref:TetR/AcrR family transcriptional regulator n=1 Tax=Alkalibacillus silvisoli TaxID=392823 RepID=A0ABP3JG39_9BACI
MNNKETIILENAIKLFSHKGFSSTSIKEIADESGIAKGSMYVHFKSKDELLIAALDYYFDQVIQQVESMNGDFKDPRDTFTQQLTTFFESVMEHREFMTLPYEQGGYLSESIREVIREKHAEVHQFYASSLKQIYGEQISPYIYDLSIMLDGVIRSYLQVAIVSETLYDIKRLMYFVMNRMDDLVRGIQSKCEDPFLNDFQIRQLLKKAQHKGVSFREEIETRLLKLEQLIQGGSKESDYQVSIDVIFEELDRKQPRKPVIKGMLSNLREIPHSHRYVHEIEMILYDLYRK